MEKYLEVIFGIPVNNSYVYTCAPDTAVGEGCRVLAPLRNRKLTGYVISVASEPPPGISRIKSIIKVIDKAPVFNRESIEMARWMSRLYMCSEGEALQAMLPGARQEREYDSFINTEEPPAREYVLAPQQTNAVNTVLASGEQYFYLNGVTGSGKTEVYLSVAEAVLKQGKGVIYLVPEISLTHQVLEVFYHRFGRQIAILHSALTRSQKLYEWMRILGGEVKLVIGARSAVFAPLADTGLIVIDEEHEGSYKSSSTPRYHARQVAMYRCRKTGALLILGSATPSLESYYQIKTGGLRELSMPERLGGGSMPEMVIVDMKKEKHTLSGTLVREMQRVHSLGRQTILFLNRRGFAYYFHCRSCGYEMKCRNCSVSLTFHKAQWKMICHYCGYKAEPVQVCPQCSSLDVGYSGFGTEKIEEQIREIFPDMVIRRVDTDTVRRKNTLQTVLRDFRSGKIDVLLGTQMVSKGLNFPGVMLVGIISADTGLQLPDFRAAERTFNLIVQVAGRAGRTLPDGEVIIQSFQPQNPAIVLASRGDTELFYETELAVREELEFPPFMRLIRIVFRGKDRKMLATTIQQFGAALPQDMKNCCQVLGPVECPLAVIAGNYRYHILFRTTNLNRLHGYLSAVIAGFRKPQQVYLEIDVDPVALL